ncbi:MAG: FAD-binding oxidoreductase [Verrucomicrobia bacterium]|nr:FAD-binding oxidoreductase [Verrucomicrobiota bacterium]MBI3867340.1 FAD-binding oxidoreductase [Verrucomicrobiota bacterium]
MIPLSDAEFIIIGGGAVGCGVAYSLARAGKTDVLLIEKAADVAQATSAQGAGLCGQPRPTAERTRLAMHSVHTFRELQKDPKVQPEWHEVGSLRLALTEKRAQEFRQLKSVADEVGLETELIHPGSAARLCPSLDFKGATAILWCPSDGYMRPYAVASSYAYQCRKLGVRIATDTTVENILTENGRVAGVATNRGKAACRYVINAAGAHAYHLARLAGIELPIVPVRHEYYVTTPLAGWTPELPCFRVPDLTLYGRPCEGGLLLGGWEPKALNTDPRSFDLAGEPPPVVPDWEVLNHFEKQFAPILGQTRISEKARVGRGWPTFTPDGRFIIGESRRMKGYIMAGGCNAHGISGSAGIGRLVVESILEKNPSPYLHSLSPDRFTETSWTWEQARVQAAHVYETYYGV